MADVSLGPPDRDRLFGGEDASEADRGQLLLVAGLVMAVSLVTLVVLLNATIYSENVATRGVASADGEALEVRATAVDGTGELIDATNRAGPGGHGNATETVRDGVTDLDAEMSRSYAERGGVTHLELLGVQNGTRITGAITGNATGDPNASTLARDVDRTRGFVLDVDPGNLTDANATSAVDDAFHVDLDNSTGGSRQVYVYNGSDGNVTVAVGENGSVPAARCAVPPDGRGRVAVDLTGERLGDRPCPGIWPTTLVAPDDAYDIALMNASAAGGEVTATARPVSGDTVTADPGFGATPAVYGASIELRYRTAELRFETAVRVAPGEPDA
ncbi:hypothetical protein C471_15142 [Halorubrum saccharovorum DSM 1137]|uniref:Uncharacterized protein n=1 Tax=Halorubrum saccharovorum DSM 1137 TaxID=1227484 RepID=M0DKY4_9EURY|nr:hypothetical protein [Halorubrum saccharovorum]ELZ36156.1 hypothetical protein C471_15142 [Halorubrum saccharovorum DSM 1137]